MSSEWAVERIDDASDSQLFTGLATILRELQKRGLIRSRKIVGDYAEFLVADLLNGMQAESGAQVGYDLTLANGCRIQVKARQATASSTPTHFGDFSTLDGDPFDDFVGIVFDSDFRVIEAYRATIDLVRESCRTVHGKQRLSISALRGNPAVETLAIVQ